jgi:predicted acylesterase/phospholipase RssA
MRASDVDAEGRSQDKVLPAFEDRAPRDRYCDLILTGGVTSAIAYPAAIFALATVYRFNAIGGSSSGGGTAALAAAAEYRRRHGSADGFRTLLEKMAEIGDEIGGRTRLAWLFQPLPQHRRLFRAIVPGIASPVPGLSKYLRALALAYAVPIALGFAAAALAIWAISRHAVFDGWFGEIGFAAMAAVFTLVLMAIGLALALAVDVARVVNDDFGLCTGLHADPGAPHPPLTVWLHRLIQDTAGRGEDDDPLTFADLAGAPGSPRETLGDGTTQGTRSIDLRMFTANITHGRPYLLPLGADDPQLYFRPAEMRRLFPATIVEHMKRCSSPVREDVQIAEPRRAEWSARSRSAAAGEDDDEQRLWPLPTERLPIVVAARMSVSFPVLFSAVPLWARDESATQGEAPFRRCLFSDGGLCSNFPIHLFDSLVPAWPTFGISLLELGPEARESTVTLPDRHWKGAEDRWNLFEDRDGTFARFAGFIGALVATMKDWNDATLARLPGVRERVARVGLQRGIGGLNILMSREDIRSLAELGGTAARLLLDRYASPSSPQGFAAGWNEHRWVRLNVLQACLRENLRGLARAAAGGRYAMPLTEQIDEAVACAPLRDERSEEVRGRLLPAQAADLKGVLMALVEAERAFGADPPAQPYAPQPGPRLAIRPPL